MTIPEKTLKTRAVGAKHVFFEVVGIGGKLK